MEQWRALKPHHPTPHLVHARRRHKSGAQCPVHDGRGLGLLMPRGLHRRRRVAAPRLRRGGGRGKAVGEVAVEVLAAPECAGRGRGERGQGRRGEDTRHGETGCKACCRQLGGCVVPRLPSGTMAHPALGSLVVAGLGLEAVRVHAGHQPEVHALHDALGPGVAAALVVVGAQPLGQCQRERPPRRLVAVHVAHVLDGRLRLRLARPVADLQGPQRPAGGECT